MSIDYLQVLKRRRKPTQAWVDEMGFVSMEDIKTWAQSQPEYVFSNAFFMEVEECLKAKLKAEEEKQVAETVIPEVFSPKSKKTSEKPQRNQVQRNETVEYTEPVSTSQSAEETGNKE